MPPVGHYNERKSIPAHSPNGDTTMSDDFVITPGGRRPRSQVHKIEKGHFVDMSTGRLLKRHVSGRVMADLGSSQRPSAAPRQPGPANPAVQWIVYGTWTPATSPAVTS